MKKHLLLLTLCLAITLCVSAQKNYDIKGIVTDTLGDPLIGSTIMLLDMDSTFVDFARAEIDGSFEIKKVPVGNHLLKITFIGYIPITQNVSYIDGDIDLGQIQLTEIAEELMEVVIKAAKAPIKMRGDTIEYDASTFKVPEGSTVEDLLRRLPGLEVDGQGEITADGNNVTKVTVDGKQFFGGDPKAATKNIQAAGISKVQVFDTKTEEEEITGTDDKTNQDKTLNLELKEEYKSGKFGKIMAGYGNEERRELKGNYNRFNEKIQFSLLGVANNTGRNGLSWDDYQGFMGSQSWTFGSDGVYGFGGGGGMRFFTIGGGNDDNLEGSLQNIFFAGSQAGFPNNYNGGTNFNYEHKKTKINAYYFINSKGLDATRKGLKETFLSSGNATEGSENTSETTAVGHRAEIGIEQELDSLHTIVWKSQFAAINNNGQNKGGRTSQFAQNNFITNQSAFDNNNNTQGHLLNSRILLRKKFKNNKRRRMGANVSYQYSTINEHQLQKSTNEFFDEVGLTARDVIHQNYDNIASKDLWSANALYVEPISEKFTIQTFYNFSDRQESGDRDVVDIADGENQTNAFLTRNYDNDITLHRVGSSLKYAHNGLNISIGAGYQNFDLQGSYQGAEGSGILGKVDNTFTNWIPNASLSFNPFRNANLNLSYDVSAQEPSIRNLQPIIDNSNPLYLREGNPDLTPEISKNVNLYFSYSRPLSGFRIYLNGGYGTYSDQIITEEFITEDLVTRVKPINFDGGRNFNFWSGINFPIKKNKLTMNLSLSTSQRNSNAYVNNVLNETTTTSYRPGVRINITPSQDFTVYINSRFGFSNTGYNINTALDQKSQNFTHNMDVSTKLFAGIKLNTKLSLSQYRNDRLNLDRDVPILNVSLYRHFLPGNKMEVRLSLYDAFNQNTSISQYASNYFINRSETATLARYGLLSITYNIKGMKSNSRRGGFHF